MLSVPEVGAGLAGGGSPPVTNPFRIIVTGSRYCNDREADYVRHVLHVATIRPLRQGRLVVIVEGRCPKGGVDLVAQRWAEETIGVENEGHPADWDRLGKSAGPVRNEEMAVAGGQVCLAFPHPQSTGTPDMIRRATAHGIHVRIYPLIAVGKGPTA